MAAAAHGCYARLENAEPYCRILGTAIDCRDYFAADVQLAQMGSKHLKGFRDPGRPYQQGHSSLSGQTGGNHCCDWRCAILLFGRSQWSRCK